MRHKHVNQEVTIFVKFLGSAGADPLSRTVEVTAEAMDTHGDNHIYAVQSMKGGIVPDLDVLAVLVMEAIKNGAK